MKPSFKKFAIMRLRHLAMLILWGAGIVFLTKITRQFIIQFTGKDYGNDNISVVGAAGLAIGIIWIGMTILAFMEFRTNESIGENKED
jgi:hypothetical protein